VRIAANEALMRLRKRRPNQFSLDEPIEGDEDLIPASWKTGGQAPSKRFAQTEMHEILSEVIDKLEPDFRVVFVLRDIEELSTEETAKGHLGFPFRAVKSRLLRARLKLRQKLNRYFGRVAQIELQKASFARFRNLSMAHSSRRKHELERHLEHWRRLQDSGGSDEADDRRFL